MVANSMNTLVLQERHKYLTQLIAEASDLGVSVFLEDKELWFKDFVLKSHPEIFNNGVFCPSQDFWWKEFLPAKYTELFIALPQLTGVITSFGTGESRLALNNIHECGCSQCKNLDPVEWHRKMTLGMYGPFRDAGKKLVIRDFVFQRSEHAQFAKALEKLPIDIVLSLKNTPHDFYPTFPNNPLIGKVGEREQWIEYDVHGQYFGWGMAPSIMTDDLIHRLRYGRECNAKGFIMRTDWEGIQDHSCFDTVNLVNLYAAAMFGENPDTDKREIYTRWLTEEKLIEEGLSPTLLKKTLEWIINLLEQTWPVVRSTLFVNGTVFSDSSAFHVNLRQSTWIAETLHSLKDWTSDADNALRLQSENTKKILDEKGDAVNRSNVLYGQVTSENPGLKPKVYEDLVQRFDFLRVYAEGFRLTTRIYVFSRLLEERGNDLTPFLGQSPRDLLIATIDELRTYKEKLKPSHFAKIYPANALLDPDRLDCFLKDAEKYLGAHVL